MKARGKRLQEEFECESKIFDLIEFWKTTETLPNVVLNGRAFSESFFLHFRFNNDGSLKKTCSQIAKDLDLTYNQARYQCERALRHMRHPYRSKNYLKDKIT